MPQGTRKCGCPARWCSCGKTVNKSELRNQSKVAAAKKVVAPPLASEIQASNDARIQRAAAKVAAKVLETSKKNGQIGKPVSKLQLKIEAALQRSEENAKPVKEPILKQGRTSTKALGLDNVAFVSLPVSEGAVTEKVGIVPAKQPPKKSHKKKEKTVHESAPQVPRPTLRNRAAEIKDVEKVQVGQAKVQAKEEGHDCKVSAHPVSAVRLRSRIKNQITRIRREEALLEAYGGSREKLRPEEELLRARNQIHRSKLAIRGAVRELEIISCHGGTDGHSKHELITCAVCQSGQITRHNDILLCDGGCNRAFHQYCLEPAVTPDKMPADEDSWLCPACDVKLDCIHAINRQFGTKLLITSSWEDVFPVEAQQEATGAVPAPQDPEWPSDDSEDEDFDPDKDEDSGGDGPAGDEQRENHENRTGDGEVSNDGESDDSDGDMEEDVTDEETKALLEEAGAGAADGRPIEVDEERPKDLIVEGKRRRTPVDYKILNFALFGFDDVTDDSDEDEKGPSKKRSKNGLGEPIFTNDVTGAPTPKADVSTPPEDGPVSQVKEEAEAEVGVTGTDEAVENGDTVAVDLKDQDVLDLKGGEAEADMKAHSNGLPRTVEGMVKGAAKGQSRASKYWPELEEVVYNMLKASFLENQIPSPEEKQELSEQLKLPLEQVNRWFHSYRQKVLTALNRPPDPEPIPVRPPGSKYPLLSASEVAAEEAAERDRRLNMVLASTGKLRAALEKAAELRRVALENGVEVDSEADSPTYRTDSFGWKQGRKEGDPLPPGILKRLKRKAEGLVGFAVKKGKRTMLAQDDSEGKSSEARALQSTLKRLAALDTRPLSVNGNRMGRPPIRMVELMAEVETLHGKVGGQLLAKRRGLKPIKTIGRPPTLLQQSLIRSQREVGADSEEGSDGSGSGGSGRVGGSQKGGENAGDADGAGEKGRLQVGRPPKGAKEEAELNRGGSFTSNQSFDEDESGLEDSWVAALDKRPFSKNGKRMGRPSRQVKEAILQFRLEKQAAVGFQEDAGPEGGSAGTESTEDFARALADVSGARDGPLPKFTKSGKRIGRPPRAMRKPESKAPVLPEPAPPPEPLHRSDSFGSLDGSTVGPDGVRYSKSGRRIGKPQRLGVVDDPEELPPKGEEAPPFLAGPSRRMTSVLGSFDDLTAAIDHLERPAAKVPRRERSADRVLDERVILNGLRARAASSNKLSAFATSSGNEMGDQDSGGALGAAGGALQEAQSAGNVENGPFDGVNGPFDGVGHRLVDPFESLFTAAAAHEPVSSPDGERNEEREGNGDVPEAPKELLGVEQLLIAVTIPGLAEGFVDRPGLVNPPGFEQKTAVQEPAEIGIEQVREVTKAPDTDATTQQVPENGMTKKINDFEEKGDRVGSSEATASVLLPFGSKFSSSSGDLAAMAASLMAPVRRPDRPPRKGGKRAFSSLARSGSVPGFAGMSLATQSSSGAPSEGTSS